MFFLCISERVVTPGRSDEDAAVSVELQDLPQSLLGRGHSFLRPLAFGGLIADGRGVGGVPLGGVQRGGHGGVTVLVLGVGGAWRALIVPGLAAAVALAVHGALLGLQAALLLLL